MENNAQAKKLKITTLRTPWRIRYVKFAQGNDSEVIHVAVKTLTILQMSNLGFPDRGGKTVITECV